MSEFSMKPSNVFARIVKWLERHDREIARLASAPIRNASIDGPVTISHRGAVTSTADDGSATRIAGGMAEVQSAPDEPWVPITAQSEADAQAALDAAAQAVLDAAAALLAANEAQSSADGKSTITYSTATPTGSAPENSTWFRFSGGVIIGQWKRTAGVWVSQTIDNAVIANLDAGKLTAGILNVALVTIQTAATGARVVFNGSGLVGYDADGNVKTVIDTATGKITAVDGAFTGTVTGSVILGGAISIAQGTSSSLDENFEAASGTTAPTGWTRQVVNTYGSGGISFLTTGGNPGRRAQLAMVNVPSGQSSKNFLFPTSLLTVDSLVEYDYMWAGTSDVGLSNPSEVSLCLRAKAADVSELVQPDVILRMNDGKFSVWAGNTRVGSIPPSTGIVGGSTLPKNAWHRVRAVLRGQTMTVQITPQGGTPYALWSGTIDRAATAGRVAFLAQSAGLFGGSGGADQTVWIDNVHVESLSTGLSVGVDGATSVEKLSIGTVGMSPDPMGPTDIVNLRSMLAVLPVTRVVTSGAVGNTNASGYVTVPVSPALTGTPRAVNVLPNNSQLIGSCDLLNSSATSLRIYFRTITSAGSPVLASTNPGQFSWTAFP